MTLLKNILASYHQQNAEANKFLHDLTPAQKIRRDKEAVVKTHQFKKQINSRPRKKR